MYVIWKGSPIQYSSGNYLKIVFGKEYLFLRLNERKGIC
jgi:hypothetical protein